MGTVSNVPIKNANLSFCWLYKYCFLTYSTCYQLVLRICYVNWSLVPGVSCYDVEFKHEMIEIALKS